MTAPDPLAAWLDALGQAHAAATPGPWWQDAEYPRDIASPPGGGDVGSAHDPADAAAIVAEHNALPELLRLARERYALEAAVLALADELDADAADQCGPLRDRIRDTADRLRATVTAVLPGQHTTDEEG